MIGVWNDAQVQPTRYRSNNMPPKAAWSKERVIEHFRLCAARRGGWVSVADFYGTGDFTKPATPVLFRMFECEPSWAALCAAVGVPSCHEQILGEVLTEDEIKIVLRQTCSALHAYTDEHMQQAALYSLHTAAKLCDGELIRERYKAIAAKYTLMKYATIVTVFGTWNDALAAAGLPVAHYRSPRKQSNATNERQQQRIVDGMISEAVPSNWRTMDVALQTLEPVTEVTLYALANGLGLRHEVTRACIR